MKGGYKAPAPLEGTMIGGIYVLVIDEKVVLRPTLSGNV
jgi:hypothetical protein